MSVLYVIDGGNATPLSFRPRYRSRRIISAGPGPNDSRAIWFCKPRASPEMYPA